MPPEASNSKLLFPTAKSPRLASADGLLSNARVHHHETKACVLYSELSSKEVCQETSAALEPIQASSLSFSISLCLSKKYKVPCLQSDTNASNIEPPSSMRNGQHGIAIAQIWVHPNALEQVSLPRDPKVSKDETPYCSWGAKEKGVFLEQGIAGIGKVPSLKTNSLERREAPAGAAAWSP